MKRFDAELSAGLFLLLGIFTLAFISIKLGKLEVIGRGEYTLYAEFEKAGGKDWGFGRDCRGRGGKGEKRAP